MVKKVTSQSPLNWQVKKRLNRLFWKNEHLNQDFVSALTPIPPKPENRISTLANGAHSGLRIDHVPITGIFGYNSGISGYNSGISKYNSGISMYNSGISKYNSGLLRYFGIAARSVFSGDGGANVPIDKLSPGRNTKASHGIYLRGATKKEKDSPGFSTFFFTG